MGGASKARRKYRTRPLGDSTRGLRHKILSTKHIDDVAYTDMYVCLDCFGTGTRVYGNTATWRKKRGAISGQALFPMYVISAGELAEPMKLVRTCETRS